MNKFYSVRAKSILEDKKLYKYRSFTTKNEYIVEDIILNNKIRFAKPDELNDELECKPKFVLGNMSSILYKKKLERWAVKTQHSLVTKINKKEFKKHFRSLSNNDHKEKVRLINEDNQRFLNEKWRILSLSSNPLQKDLWEVYANNNKGLCLIFNASSFEFGGAFKVYYPNKRLEPDITSQNVQEILQSTILTKTINWAYEEEYRVISCQPHKGPTVILDDSQFFNFHPSLLVGVIFGYEMTNTDREKIITMCKKRESKLDLWEVIISKDNKLKLCEI